jgi:hypothetical protein
MAFRAFFSVLGGTLPEDLARAFGYSKEVYAQPRRTAEPAQIAGPEQGALQLLGALQREARLLDFFLEDIAGYRDEEVGAVARTVHASSQETLRQYFRFAPVIDGVEGTYTKPASAGALAKDASAIRFLGNLPAQGKPAGGTLRHRGWRVDGVTLPKVNPKQNLMILAPAELEVE